MKKYFILLLTFLLFFSIVYSIAPEEEIEVEPKFISGNIGDEITFTITIHQLCKENCKISIEDTEIKLYDLEKKSQKLPGKKLRNILTKKR